MLNSVLNVAHNGQSMPSPGRTNRRGLVHIVELSTIDDMIDRHGSDAAFVVLGSRFRRRISERLRPSATNQITGRTTCPVISVPKLALTSTVQGTVKNEP